MWNASSSSTALLDPLLVWIAAALIATLFAHAALAKFGDLDLFEQHLAAYGAARLPLGLQALLSRLIPSLELLTAVLSLSPARSLGAGLALLLLLSYAALMAWHRLQRHSLDCGCGGAPLPVSWLLVGRNLALALLAWLATGTDSGRALGLADFAVLVGSLVLALPLYAAFNQVLRHPLARRLPPAGHRGHAH